MLLLRAITIALGVSSALGFSLAPAVSRHPRAAAVMCGPTYDPAILDKCMEMRVSELKAEL